MKKLFPIALIIMIVMLLAVALPAAAAPPTLEELGEPAEVKQGTCPDGNGWTKIDSNDLSSYPVDGATAYCFKAGSSNSQGCIGGLFDSIPSGGFNQPYCGLSHWSYYDPGDDDGGDDGGDDDGGDDGGGDNGGGGTNGGGGEQPSNTPTAIVHFDAAYPDGNATCEGNRVPADGVIMMKLYIGDTDSSGADLHYYRLVVAGECIEDSLLPRVIELPGWGSAQLSVFFTDLTGKTYLVPSQEGPRMGIKAGEDKAYDLQWSLMTPVN